MDLERRAGRTSYFGRSRSRMNMGFKKRRNARKAMKYQAPLERAITAKAIIVKLRTLKDMTTSTNIARSVYGLVAVLREGNDWTNYQNSYQQFNILKVSVRIILGTTEIGSTTLPNAHAITCCYDTANNSALTALNQSVDHEQYWIAATANANASDFHKFSFAPRPTVKPPQSTAVSTENYGYLKFYSDTYDGATVFAAKLIFTFTIAFGSES